MKEISIFKKVIRKIVRVAAATLVSFGIVSFIGVAFAFYGPIPDARELYITTAMTTMNHHYLATWFFSKEEIGAVMEKNKIHDEDKNSKPDSTVMEEERLKLEQQNREIPDIVVDPLTGKTFKGWMITIKDPSWVKVGSSKYLGNRGEHLENMLSRYGAILGINAGGFKDVGGHGNGGQPKDILVENGKIKFAGKDKSYQIIGFNEQNVLVLGHFTASQLKENHIRDAVAFGPYLIVDGEPLIKKGSSGGAGIQPRSCIGQTKDGRVLFLIIDGRQPTYSIGATLRECQDLMLQYGAVNAANLDGGASTTFYYNGELMNKPCSKYGERYLPSTFMVVK